jgi:hypothetical protein
MLPTPITCQKLQIVLALSHEATEVPPPTTHIHKNQPLTHHTHVT